MWSGTSTAEEVKVCRPLLKYRPLCLICVNNLMRRNPYNLNMIYNNI